VLKRWPTRKPLFRGLCDSFFLRWRRFRRGEPGVLKTDATEPSASQSALLAWGGAAGGLAFPTVTLNKHTCGPAMTLPHDKVLSG